MDTLTLQSFYEVMLLLNMRHIKATGNYRSGIPANMSSEKFPREFPGIFLRSAFNFYHASLCEGGLGSRNSVCLSVRLSVCLSVTRVDCDKTK